MYNPPKEAFIADGNGVGIVHAIDRDVWHLKMDQHVMLSSHFTAAENIKDPVQILIGVTALRPDVEKVQADWRNGTLSSIL
jgi:alcohol dehydrogenase